MSINDQTRIRLLGAIESNGLVLLCGAGLSVSAPSRLMSAIGVSRACYDKYQAIEPLELALRDNIDNLAGHFHQAGTFDRLFINSLVPWDELTGQPNAGHAAVGDFLLSGAAAFALSTNFDAMIEQWCQSLKAEFGGAQSTLEREGRYDGLARRRHASARVAVAAIVGNEDGAHFSSAQIFQALNDVGWTIPSVAACYWVGEAMGSTNFKDLQKTPGNVADTASMVAGNAAHLAASSNHSLIPAESGVGS